MSGRDAREKSEVRLDSDARGDRYLLLADPVPRGREPQAAILTLRNTDGLRKLTSLLDESHRMIAWGQVALGVAHEIKNPLQAMNLHLDLAREKIIRAAGDADMSGPIRNLGVVGQQIRRLDDVVNGFLRFARMTHAEREPLNLNGILSEVRAWSPARPRPPASRCISRRSRACPRSGATAASCTRRSSTWCRTRSRPVRTTAPSRSRSTTRCAVGSP